MSFKDPAEKVVRDIRRKMRRKYSAKTRIVLEGLRGEDNIAPFAVARGSPKAFTTAGRRSFWKRVSSVWPGTRRAKRPVLR